MVAEHKTQMAKIGREKFNELFGLMPSLSLEINRKKGSQTVFGDDYIRQVFKNKSEFDLVGITNSSRGGRRHSLLSEEVNFALTHFFLLISRGTDYTVLTR
jgi:hypothetical protein